MQTSNAKHNFSSDDPVWILLAELSLRDFLSDIDRREGLTAGYLLQTVQELDVPAECVETITRLVAEFAKESPLNYNKRGWNSLDGSEYFARKNYRRCKCNAHNLTTLSC